MTKVRTTLLAAALLAAGLTTAGATDLGFAGEWRGVGTDRKSGDQQPVAVRCRASNSASGAQVQIKTTCEGATGRQDITASLVFQGQKLVGTLSRRTSDMPMTVSGTVAGQQSGNTTRFDVHAFFKTRARVALASSSPSSYTLRVTDPDDGATLMHVTFRKI
jgi:hypothetical protein